MEKSRQFFQLSEDGKSIRAIAQTLAIASTTIWNVLIETTDVLSMNGKENRKTSAVEDKRL